jgi:hypothetical protein
MRGQQGLRIRNDGLDLHDEEHPAPGMPGKDVNRATLAEVVERHLDGDLPATRHQQLNRSLDESGMSGVEQAIECLAVPSNTHLEIGTERSAQGFDVTEGRPDELASLEA